MITALQVTCYFSLHYKHITVKTQFSQILYLQIQLVTCAKCEQEIPTKQWSLHNLHKHNNMAWQKDKEPLVIIRLITSFADLCISNKSFI